MNNTYPYNKEGVNYAVESLNNIFNHTASISCLKTTNRTHKNSQENEKWFDRDCKAIRKNVRLLSNQKHRRPNDPGLRLNYFNELKKYKNTLRKKREQFTQNQLKKIEESIDSNNFWKNWNTLNKKKHEELAIQDGEIWKSHFENLYSKCGRNPEQTEIYQKMIDMENTINEYQNPLDYPITDTELTEKLQGLQPKKACGPDGILNEMLTNISHNLRLAILKLFNFILSVGYFPDVWNKGLITPLFKSGDKSDPNNYRGICVSSNLGKLFCSILNQRIINFLIEHNALSRSQIGFLPKCRTSDHIFTLHTLIDKYVHQNKTKIFACFIDFQKAFDSIWHNGLFFKLLETGIGGKTFKIIKTMYSNNKCAIRIGNKHTEFFSQERGVRQGCPLSPTLFNIYINELANTIQHSAGPGLALQDTEVKCLLYADDLVLLSPSKEGLQHHMDKVANFCQTWALKMNPKKTKVLVFRKRSRLQGNTDNFKIGNTKIDQTCNYTYLGITLTSTGNFGLAAKELKEKAKRAFYAIKRSIKLDIPIRIWLKIFKSVIEPIALYGCEVWGPATKGDFSNWDKHPTEALHAEFCKSILRVQRKTPNNACRAELGQYPLIIDIQKRAVKFWQHLKMSDPHSLHYQALKCQELNIGRSPLTQLVLRLSDLAPNLITEAQDNDSVARKIRPNQITNTEKENYITYWKEATKTQSKLQCYLTLKREYSTATYLNTVKDTKLRKTLTMYRLSEHHLAIERGRHRQTWLPREERLCSQCSLGAVETEVHFLTECHKYETIRKGSFDRFNLVIPGFQTLTGEAKLPYILGEDRDLANLAAGYVAACHNLRDSH